MESRIRVYLFLIGMVILIGTPGFMITEGLSLIDALYFCIVTIATVGYGDITPVTPAGKVLAMFVIIGGVGSFVGLVVNAIESWFSHRDRQNRLKKLNLLIGAFFSEIGIKLLVRFSLLDPEIAATREMLLISGEWTDQSFTEVRKALAEQDYQVDIRKADLREMRRFLFQRRDFLLRLLENPMLFEQERFTDMLQAIFHLTEELGYRGDLQDLPGTDLEHLERDMKRIYELLVVEWLEYMRYLKENYPYLFSLAMRTNPFDTEASAVVE